MARSNPKEEKTWCEIPDLKNMIVYAVLKGKRVVDIEGSVMRMRDDKWRWNIKATGENGFEGTEEAAKEKVVEMLGKGVENEGTKAGVQLVE